MRSSKEAEFGFSLEYFEVLWKIFFEYFEVKSLNIATAALHPVLIILS